MGHTEDAKMYIEHGLNLDPNSGYLNLLMGETNISNGSYEDAVNNFVKTLEENPKNANAFNNCGVALAKLGKSEEAIVGFLSALNIDNAHNDAKSNLDFAFSQKPK